jgi:hypothetical protein
MGTQNQNNAQPAPSVGQGMSPKEIREYGIVRLKWFIENSDHQVAAMERIAALEALAKYINE